MEIRSIRKDIGTGLMLDTINYEDILSNLKEPPLLVNDLDLNYPEDEEKLNKYLMTNYDTVTFSMVPKCDCGYLVGGYLRGRICPQCNHEVLTHTEVPIQSNLWIKVPDGVRPFLSPIAYLKLTQTFEHSKVDVIRWLCDTHYKVNVSNNDVIAKLKDRDIKRGYNNFIDNFWEYMDILLNEKIYTSASDKRKDIMGWLTKNKNNLFTNYIALPNRISLVTEKTTTGRYGEIEKFGGAIEAANVITSLKTRIEEPSQNVKESAAIRVLILLSNFYKYQYRDSLGRKEGWIRKHICSSRMPFTARNVITSLHEVHEYDELHVPWAMAIGLYRLQLTNKFLRDGYNPNDISKILTGHVNRYHPKIREYFDELIEECPHKGLPVILNRNPTLLRGSIQLLYITKIKDNINDNTISLSVLVLSPYNAVRPYWRV